jgi:hypothetical protein
MTDVLKAYGLDDDSVLGPYFDELGRLIETDKNPKDVAVAIAERLGTEHSLSVLKIMSEMAGLYKEMRSVLNEFTGRNYGLMTILTVDHLASAMKMYVISWYTMLDLVARSVNAAFNLGIADGDVRLPQVLRNAHVKSSRIPEILRTYKSTLCIKDLDKKRNDVVHRAWTPDPEVDALRAERNSIDARRYSLLQKSPISDDEYKQLTSDMQKRLNVSASAKRELWEKLHSQTIAMTSKVARELAGKTLELYRKDVIPRHVSLRARTRLRRDREEPGRRPEPERLEHGEQFALLGADRCQVLHEEIRMRLRDVDPELCFAIDRRGATERADDRRPGRLVHGDREPHLSPERRGRRSQGTSDEVAS